jgi:uncharacterized protein (TIGR03435 family)
MQELDDTALLRQYAENNSEAAFATLVARYINQVYSVALRHTRNPGQAEEITQAVFVILAKKARGLGQGVILSGWLYQTARLASVTLLRSEIRRARREQEAHMQNILEQSATDETWRQIAPLLDAAMARLNETDRHAVVLRFFNGKSMREVGAALGANEEAAKKRVNRALEKLQQFFTKRGVTSTTAVIAGAISSNSILVAPSGLAGSVTAAAVAHGAGASASTLTLIKGALKVMAWTKTKSLVVVAVALLFTAGTATVAVKEIQRHSRYPWQVPAASYDMIYQFPPQAVIVPTAFQQNGDYFCDFTRGGGTIGICQPLTNIIRLLDAGDRYRLILSPGLPDGRYDFFARGPATDWGSHWRNALQDQLKTKLGVVQHLEVRNAGVLLLRYTNPGAGGLQPPDTLRRSLKMPRNMRSTMGTNSATFFLSPISSLKFTLQAMFEKPVVDQTGLTGTYDYRLTWEDPDDPDRNIVRENIKQALLNELGMELVPTNMPAEMLVVEKAN